jgi:hypothetical protein
MKFEEEHKAEKFKKNLLKAFYERINGFNLLNC